MKWIRPEYNSQDAVNDFQSQIEYKVDLPIDNESIPFDSVIKNKLWCMVNIGYPKSEFQHEIGDSLAINMNDAIGEFSDFPLLLDAELDVYNDLYPSDSLDQVLLIINAHKDTPEYYFDNIKYYLKDDIHLIEIYRTYYNQVDRLVGLKKLL